MKKTIIFVADFFLEDIVGGGEINNEELIDLLTSSYNIIKVKSFNVTPSFIDDNRDNCFIIANFIGLSADSKKCLLDKKYIIYEHDHKYLSSRNPSIYKNFISSEKNIINKDFFKNAVAVFAQSKIHAETIYKNLQIKNIINCGGNFWPKEQIDILKKYLNTEKTYDYGILDSENPIKNTFESIEYCKQNNLNYLLIPFTNFENYISNLAKCKNFIFFPKVLETLSRTAIESKILGCKLITNGLLGVASEDWIRGDKESILEYVIANQENILKNVTRCIEQNGYEEAYVQFEKLPKVSIITSIFNGEKYIDNFLKNIVAQTIFDECELILINCNSPQNEEQYILPYLQQYKNIKYLKLEADPGIYGAWNIGIENSTGDYVCNSNIDDIRTLDSLEILRKHIHYSPDIDLVYADTCVTSEIPTLEKAYPLNLSEHSVSDFSKENMIKCLPGALPLWRKSMHTRCGLFDSKYSSAGDWEMWLRATEYGCKFKKIDFLSGYYYNNPSGKSTSKEFASLKFKEEKEIFFKYKNVFAANYTNYLNWFSRDDI